MNCAWVRERLLQYLVGELAPQQRVGLARHLERCARCAALAEQLAETQEQVEAALPTPVEAPASLDARVMDAVRRLPSPRASWRLTFPRARVRQRLALASATFCLMIASFAAGSWSTARRFPSPAEAPALELALLGSAHVQSLATASPEIGTSDPRQLARALGPLLPFPVGVVDLHSDGMRLRGGSKATLHGVPVAALRYEWRGERISLFQMEARRLSPPSLRQVVRGAHEGRAGAGAQQAETEPDLPPDSYFVRKVGGLTYVAWSFGGTNCVMVAKAVPMHLLFRLACHTSEKLERA
jgi:anti-sigma factor RsiW